MFKASSTGRQFVHLPPQRLSPHGLDKRGIAYEALDNGFLSCGDAAALQEVCDALGPAESPWKAYVPLTGRGVKGAGA